MRTEINDEIHEVKHRINTLEEENRKLRSKLEYTEKRLRKYSFIIYGLEFPENQLIQTFISLINNVLKVIILESNLRDIYTLPNSKIIHVELIAFRKKKEIFANLPKLKGSKIRFAHELSQKER